jgi:class 3 adenylate cyclase/tetratricopeptide (TPR) repeat protein
MIEENRQHFEDYLEEHRDHLGSIIHDLWVSKDRDVWSKDSFYYIRLGSLADKVGQAMFAHDVLEEGLQFFPGNPRLIQLFSLSSIKCGFLLKARDLLTGLVNRGHEDEETLGILGRVYKEMWLLADKSSTDHPHFIRSKNLYLKAFLKNRGYYSGINAASLSLLAGDTDTAEKLARSVLKTCTELVKSTASRDSWVYATIGEACALLGKREESLSYYNRAKQLVGTNFADIASMRRQLNLLSRVTPIAAEVLDSLRIPPVIAFTGHMIDHPDRASPRFPARLADEVARRVSEVLDELGGQIGYASAASGSDVIFLEAIQKRGGETNVILPFERDDFFQTSVNFAGTEWRSRVDNVLAKGTRIEQATRGKYQGDDVLFSYTNQIIMGKTILRSRFLETEPTLLAVWDGNESTAKGGTAEFIQTWQKRGYPLKIIDLRTLSASTVAPEKTRRRLFRQPSPPRANVSRETVAMLFSDIVGYSRLTEEQVPRFIEGFLGTVATRLEKMSATPLYKNLWGDALYFVFAEYEAAAEYALELRDMMRETDWKKLGLPGELSMRIGLHAGPVFRSKEPFLNRENFFGFNVNQAARIEPITRPGNVYASEQYAALLMGTGADHLDCRYVGVIVLPKDFGSYPIYHVKRKHEIE